MCVFCVCASERVCLLRVYCLYVFAYLWSIWMCLRVFLRLILLCVLFPSSLLVCASCARVCTCISKIWSLSETYVASSSLHYTLCSFSSSLSCNLYSPFLPLIIFSLVIIDTSLSSQPVCSTHHFTLPYLYSWSSPLLLYHCTCHFRILTHFDNWHHSTLSFFFITFLIPITEWKRFLTYTRSLYSKSDNHTIWPYSHNW